MYRDRGFLRMLMVALLFICIATQAFAAMFCPKCKKVYTDKDVRFCKEDGTTLKRQKPKKKKQPRTALVAPAASAAPLHGFTDQTTGMEFVPVRGGWFRMGDTFGDGEDDEKPVHDVRVSDFHMGKFEVTNAQYRKFYPGHNSGDYEGKSLNGDNQPVVRVTWHDADAYAKWLTLQSGRIYRLSTEAEWEFAARGGTKNLRNYWGNGTDDACRYANVADQSAKRIWPNWSTIHECDDDFPVAAPVGKFQPNAFGLHDMMGNAWEWVNDIYAAYPSSRRQNPDVQSGGSFRVVRGGSWDSGPGLVRAASRSDNVPGDRDNHLGFRLVSPVR
jgi:formylglycine-generating enzyme